jgi:hypothetical protein
MLLGSIVSEGKIIVIVLTSIVRAEPVVKATVYCAAELALAGAGVTVTADTSALAGAATIATKLQTIASATSSLIKLGVVFLI